MPDILSQGTVRFARSRWASGAAPPCSEAVEICASHEAIRAENEHLTKELAEARKVIGAARCIRHWHDSGRNNEGMVVSSSHVRELWGALASYDAIVLGSTPEGTAERSDTEP